MAYNILTYEAITTATEWLKSLAATIYHVYSSIWFWNALVAMLAYRGAFFETIFIIIMALFLNIIAPSDLIQVTVFAVLGFMVKIGLSREKEITTGPAETLAHALTTANWRLAYHLIRRGGGKG